MKEKEKLGRSTTGELEVVHKASKRGVGRQPIRGLKQVKVLLHSLEPKAVVLLQQMVQSRASLLGRTEMRGGRTGWSPMHDDATA